MTEEVDEILARLGTGVRHHAVAEDPVDREQYIYEGTDMGPAIQLQECGKWAAYDHAYAFRSAEFATLAEALAWLELAINKEFPTLTRPVSTPPSQLAVFVKRRLPTPSAVYPVFWQFAAERQRVYKLRVAGHAPPWTTDDILLRHRFTNPYRAADRVSQTLIRMVYAEDGIDAPTMFLRTMLFKIFNKATTWASIVSRLGLPNASTYDVDAHDRILTELRAKGTAIYSGAYIMPSGGAGLPKHRMHLELLARMLADRLPDKIEHAKGLPEIYNLLLSYPSLGPFLAFQYTIDLGYTPLVRHAESGFVVAGPGALDGISKCFESLGDYTPAEIVMWLTDIQHVEFALLGIEFDDLWGRALQPIDVQNLFCEVSKYTRVSHPTVTGVAGRTRIKQQFQTAGAVDTPFFPPAWGINHRIDRWLRENRQETP